MDSFVWIKVNTTEKKRVESSNADEKKRSKKSYKEKKLAIALDWKVAVDTKSSKEINALVEASTNRRHDFQESKAKARTGGARKRTARQETLYEAILETRQGAFLEPTSSCYLFLPSSPPWKQEYGTDV